MKQAYVLVTNGQVFDSLKDVSDAMGTKVTRKAIESGALAVLDVQVDDTGAIVDKEGNIITLGEAIMQYAPDVAVAGFIEMANLAYTAGSGEATQALLDVIQEGVSDPDDHVEEGMEEPIEGASDPATTADATPVDLPVASEKEQDRAQEDNLAKLRRMMEERKAQQAASGTQAPTGKKGKSGVVKRDAEGNVEYPEKGHFKEEKDMKKYIKALTDEELVEWCELEGATYKADAGNASITRMRAAMAIKAIHGYGNASATGVKKGKGKYADFSTEALVQLALDNDIVIEGDGNDDRILRMKTIMALRSAGLLEAR